MELVKDSINLRRKKSWRYSALLGFILVGFFFFFTSKLFIPYDEPVYHTELKETVSLLGNRTVTLEGRAYDPESHIVEMFLHIDGGDGEKYQFQAQEKANPNLQLPVKVVYQDGENFVVQVKEVSSKWEALALDIYEENNPELTIDTNQVVDESTASSEEEEGKTFLESIFSDQDKTKRSKGISQKGKAFYAKVFIDMEKKLLQEKSKQYDVMIQQEHAKQTKWKQQITEWQSELKYLTEEEKLETDAEISSKESAIQRSKETIEQHKWEQQQIEEKMKKLDEKAKDAEQL